MGNLTCPKCGGSDAFISQRNIVKGRGIYQSGKMRGVPVCRTCDEIMHTSDSYKQIQRSRYTTKEISLYLIWFLLGYASIIFGGSLLSWVALASFFILGIYLYRSWNKRNKEILRQIQENKGQ